MKTSRLILTLLLVTAPVSFQAQIDIAEPKAGDEVDRSTDVRTELPDDKSGRFDSRGQFLGSVFKSADVVIERINHWADLAPQAIEYHGFGEVEIARPIEPATLVDRLVVRNAVVFYQLRTKPALSLDRNAVAIIEAGGAVVGFRLMPGSNSDGELLVPHRVKEESLDSEAETNETEWAPTGVYFATGLLGQSSMTFDIVIRLDADEAEWDLWLNDRLVLTDMPCVPRGPGLWIRSVSPEEGRVSELRLTLENPLFADRDIDGIPDDFEAQVGGLSDVDDRDWVLSGYSRTLMELYRDYLK